MDRHRHGVMRALTGDVEPVSESFGSCFADFRRHSIFSVGFAAPRMDCRTCAADFLSRVASRHLHVFVRKSHHGGVHVCVASVCLSGLDREANADRYKSVKN